MTPSSQKVYFPNLNGLRFIAAFLVIVHHIEQFKSMFGLDSYWGKSEFVNVIGKLGVVLFFVLSGFLITYLLLAEESVFQDISVRKFYLRRIIRIWPLYFTIVALALFVFPYLGVFAQPGFGPEVVHKDLMLKVVLYVLFLPNLVLALLGVVPYASHTWSIGTEEQFYLVWPVILKFFKKHRIVLMLAIVVIYMFIARFLLSRYSDPIPYKVVMKAFWSSFNIDCMAIGGFYAVILFQKHRLLQIFMNKYIFYGALVIVSAMLAKGVVVPYAHFEFYSVLFGIIIMNFAANKQISISLENSVLNYLGNISYGLYMYHPIGIVLALYLARQVGITTNWVLYPLGLGVTITIAALSYKYFESRILKYKARFSQIISGEETKHVEA